MAASGGLLLALMLVLFDNNTLISCRQIGPSVRATQEERKKSPPEVTDPGGILYLQNSLVTSSVIEHKDNHIVHTDNPISPQSGTLPEAIPVVTTKVSSERTASLPQRTTRNQEVLDASISGEVHQFNATSEHIETSSSNDTSENMHLHNSTVTQKSSHTVNNSVHSYLDPRYYEELVRRYKSNDGFWSIVCLCFIVGLVVFIVWSSRMWKTKDSMWLSSPDEKQGKSGNKSYGIPLIQVLKSKFPYLPKRLREKLKHWKSDHFKSGMAPVWRREGGMSDGFNSEEELLNEFD